MARWQPNQNLNDELRRTPRMRDELGDRGRRVAGAANKLAHNIMPREGEPVEVVVDQTPTRTRVVNTSSGGHIDEFGSANNRPYAPIRRAVRAIGLRLTGSR